MKMNKVRILLVCSLALSPTFSNSQSATAEQVQQVTVAVLELCRGGSSSGNYKNLEISGDGELTTVLLKGLAKAGVGGEVEFSKGDWEGILAVVPENWDQNSYNDCVVPITNSFLAALTGSSQNSGAVSASQGSVAIGNSSVRGNVSAKSD